jgi:predicted RNA-binding protein YlqC (UPF0109 family)
MVPHASDADVRGESWSMGNGNRREGVREERGDAAEELEDLLVVMAEAIVDQPSLVKVECARGEGFISFEVRCAPADVGALIGARGTNAEAMRKIFMTAAQLHGLRGQVQFLGIGEPSRRA